MRIGDPAPTFTRIAHDGTEITIGNRADRVTVLYFYPKDETPGCTAEACSFRDAYEDFVEAGAQVVGVSSDSNDKHTAFAANHRLPFALVSDADGALRKAFGVKSTLGLLPGRVTFVIDQRGIVQHVFNSQIRARKHVEEALAVVRRLSSDATARA